MKDNDTFVISTLKTDTTIVTIFFQKNGLFKNNERSDTLISCLVFGRCSLHKPNSLLLSQNGVSTFNNPTVAEYL